MLVEPSSIWPAQATGRRPPRRRRDWRRGSRNHDGGTRTERTRRGPLRCRAPSSRVGVLRRQDQEPERCASFQWDSGWPAVLEMVRTAEGEGLPADAFAACAHAVRHAVFTEPRFCPISFAEHDARRRSALSSRRGPPARRASRRDDLARFLVRRFGVDPRVVGKP